MLYLHALLLGIVQGLTEFFPVSSSTHLKLIKMACGIHDLPLAFDLSCHLGTLFALIFYLRKDLFTLFFKEQKKLLYFILALLPLIPGYFLLSPIRKMAPNLHFLGLFLIVTALLLFLGQKIQLKKTPRFLSDSLLIGALQSTALVPGISRSASTISCAKLLGWSAKDAVRFSFMLAIPTIFGGELLEMARVGEVAQFINPPCLIGFFAAFFVGLGMVQIAMRILEKGNLNPFAWYCICLGGILLLL